VDDQIKQSQCEQEFDDTDPEQWRSFTKLSIRSKRSVVFHILYAAQAYDYGMSAQLVADMFNRGYELDIPLDSDVVQISAFIIEHRDELDAKYRPFLTNWRADRLGVATKLILQYAVWELIHTPIAPSIIINEAVELAKCYAEKDAYKFINGILDEVLKTMPERQKETPSSAGDASQDEKAVSES
jgi:N utilization substance protein B